ncbi:MAG: dihydroorotase [Elusimicrobiota bacterium]
MDLSVEGKIYVNGGFEHACIGISNGKIVEIKKILKSDTHYNFGNNLILPAGVDIHVHFRDPGLTHKEDFYTGSMAAAFGGISCVLDMPNTIPQTTKIGLLSDKINSFKKKSVVDFGLYSAITNENIENIEKNSMKCNGFKIYLGSTTLSLLLDKKNLKRVFESVSKTGKPILMHAEDKECLIKHKIKEKNIKDHLRARPSLCEEISIKDVLSYSKNSGVRAHICHVSSCEGIELLKNHNRNISFGITPHHALLSIDRMLNPPSFYKVNPPLRSSFDKEALFDSIKNGTADILESDHAPHTKEEKNTDFNDSPSGIPGVETMYPIFLYLVKKQVLSFSRLLSLISSKPSEMMEIKKGQIKKGFDADFIVVNLKDETRIKADNLHSKCGWTAFEDWSAIFPKKVFIRGENVIDANEIQVSPGFGDFVGA